MTTLNLNLEIAQQVLTQMSAVYNDFRTYQKKHHSMLVAELYEAANWQGKSAKNFYDTYREVDYQAYLQLEEYGKMLVVLSDEFNAWQSMAQHLSPDPSHLFPPGDPRRG
jgi:hypothetical protein